jgi:hypothetical protein
MAPQFPYFAAIAATTTVGTLTTLVWAVQVPVPVAHVVPAPAIAPVPMATPAPVPGAALPGNAVNTPTSNTPAFPPGNTATIVGQNGAPALVRAGTYGQAGLNQPGQPPFSEFFVSQQTALNQPGQPDFYQGTNNPSIVEANQGVTPSQAYLNPTTPQTGVPPVATQAFGFATTQGNNVVGFYNGFGPGQPNFGFYNGFTAPH